MDNDYKDNNIEDNDNMRIIHGGVDRGRYQKMLLYTKAEHEDQHTEYRHSPEDFPDFCMQTNM